MDVHINCKKRRLRHLQMHLKKIRHQEMRLKRYLFYLIDVNFSFVNHVSGAQTQTKMLKGIMHKRMN